MGIFLSTIDGNIVNVAVPTLERDLGATFALVQWVVLGYLLTLSSLLYRRLGVWPTCVVKEHLPQRLCPLHIGLGPVWTGAQHRLVDCLPRRAGHRRCDGSRARFSHHHGGVSCQRAWPRPSYGSVIVSLGIMAGPTLGGLLIQYFSWRSIFYVNLPVGVIGVALVYRFVPWSPPRPGQRFDAPGACCSSAPCSLCFWR